MKNILKYSKIALIVLSAVVFAQAESEKVIVETQLGECPLHIEGSTVDIKALLDNIELRLEDLQLRTADNPEYRRLTQPLLSEIDALISLFPEEVYVIPVDAEIHRAVNIDQFEGIIDDLLAEDSLEDKFAFLKQTAKYDYFTIEQLGRILDEFEQVEDKFEATRILRDNIVDPENAYTITDKFTSKEAGRTCAEIIIFNEVE